MSKSVDERGRIYLSKEIRERYGDRYRVVELPSHVALFPVDDDPLAGAQAAVGDAFDGESVDDLKAEARDSIAETASDEASGRADDRET